MKKTRYILADEEMGVFLGTYDGEELGYEGDSRIFACFSANNPFKLTTCCSFRTERAANVFKKDMFGPVKQKKIYTLPVESEDEFPSVVDIVKAGHIEESTDLLEILFENGNQTIH